MKPQPELLAERLTQEDRAELHSIFAPRVVMTLPMDTRRGLCVRRSGRWNKGAARASGFFRNAARS